ncbi:MAG: NAD(P)/FAD-dependent oxidoreductase [Myxococcales bacterium]|jgi:NADPH-dependent 2,4-dienoyl-CoA reductase/sulfur reductase-like enzyme
MRIVIVGNGVAGIEAALAVREEQPDWDITIVSEESDHFFSRTALMWVASGQLSHHDIEPHERDLYARAKLRRVRARAVGVDVAGRRLLLSGEPDALPYDRLLIACGSRPRPAPWPGSQLTGVGHFVTLQDLAWLERELDLPEGAAPPPRADAHLRATTDDSPYRPRPVAAEARGHGARRPAVIGGGLIGIEAVEVMLAAGLSPRFFIREEWFWPMAIDARESAFITARMAEHGVEVLLEHEVQELRGEDAVQRVVTDRGEYEADVVVVAIGVIPNTDWLQGSDIALHERGGVLVDERLSSGAPDVFAAGDCAVVPWADGSRRPEQLWYTARDQGRVAGRRLLGDDARYLRERVYNSAKLMDVEYTTAGRMDVDGAQELFHEERGPVRSTTRIATVDDRVVGFNLLGRRWEHDVLCRFIDERRELSWVLEHLHEASFDTEFVPPLSIPKSAR